MRYNNQQFNHRQSAKIGILLTNLGTPAAPTKKALRTYLKQFLSDPRVVEVPRLLWWLVLHGVILNIRPARSARAYATVWTEQGSPLAIHTADQAERLARALSVTATDDDNLPVVRWAMRYGQPSIENTVQQMLDEGVQRLLVLPLYPQYSGATTGSTFDALAADFTQRRWIPELRFVASYYQHPAYISALANSIRQYWAENGRAGKLILSYHGLPLRYLHKGDPYHCQCLATSRLVAAELELDEQDYITGFQSRFGREQWLQPYTDDILKALPAKGVKSVQVVCPGFSSDCLETLEEIGVENRDYFLEAGGQDYGYIPALNSSDEHVQFLLQLCHEQLQGWKNLKTESAADAEKRDARASACAYNQQP